MRGGYIRSSLFENGLEAGVVKPVLNLQRSLGSRLHSGKIHTCSSTQASLTEKISSKYQEPVCVCVCAKVVCVCKSCVCSHMNTQSWCVRLLVVMSHLKASECCRQMNRSRSKKPFSSSKTNFVTRVRSCTGKKIIDLSQHFLVTANRKCNQTAVTCAVFLSFSSGLCWCTHCSLIPQQILRTFFY